MTFQKTHELTKNSSHNLDIVVIAENIRTPENLGMILRVSEAFGAGKVCFVGSKSVDFTTKAKRASRNTHNTIAFDFYENGKNLLVEHKEEGFKILALEITSNSKSIESIEIGGSKKLALIVGSERNGISEELLEKVDATFHIKMFGQNSSLNVVNALSVALYQITSNS